MGIQQRYSSILLAFRGPVCLQQLAFEFLASFLAQYEYMEFYVTMKTLTRTDVLRGHKSIGGEKICVGYIYQPLDRGRMVEWSYDRVVWPQEAQSRILWGLALSEAIYAVLFS